MNKEIMKAAKNALPALQRMKSEFENIVKDDHPTFKVIKDLENLITRHSIIEEKYLFDLINNLNGGEYAGVHIHNLPYPDEGDKEIYRVYTWEGYCFQIYFNKEYDPESSDGDEYDYYADWEGFKQGLTVEKAIEIITKAIE